MSRDFDGYRAFDLFFNNIISEADAASKRVLGSFLVQRNIRRNYVYIKILFICNTDLITVEKEVDLWLKVYRWIERRKELLFSSEGIQNKRMIVLYPRFISFGEYQELSSMEKANLSQLKNYWYAERHPRLKLKFPRQSSDDVKNDEYQEPDNQKRGYEC
jgi:hypothetical protein